MSTLVTCAAILIVVVGVIDAPLTLEHIRRVGATELNPIMNWVLHEFGGNIFIWTRIVATVVGVCGLLVFYQHNCLAKFGLWGITLAHMALLVWHSYIVVYLW